LEKIRAYLERNAEGDLIPWSVQTAAAREFGKSLAEIEGRILEAGFLPARYQRNRQMLSTSQQLRLFSSRVAVVGCGGLGGYILEELARLGVGEIVGIDPDIFEEHNLNRQLLSSPGKLGQPKVEAAAERLAQINPAVIFDSQQTAFSRENGSDLFARSAVVVDALDSISVRLELEEVCSSLGLPLVHGAIAGWYGHVASVYPGDNAVKQIYSHWKEGKGAEQKLGNPSFTPAVVASLQVAEVCKILLGEGNPLRGRKLSIDLLNMEIVEVPLG
jgi:molybdopterin-synthase adenylyltransferase